MNTELMAARAEIERLRAEVERLTDVLDKTARECAEEEIRLGSCINDMNNDNRELRAEIERTTKERIILSNEVARLTQVMLEAQTLCANDRGGNAIYLIRDALAGKGAE
jgi:predicted RNase H-like nuclease (RuvC/YqgF family)